MNYSLWGKLILAFLGGALITGLAVAVYFLGLSNDKLEAEAEMLRNTRNNLITTVQEVEAESARLKAQALENDVFLQ